MKTNYPKLSFLVMRQAGSGRIRGVICRGRKVKVPLSKFDVHKYIIKGYSFSITSIFSSVIFIKPDPIKKTTPPASIRYDTVY